MRLLNNIKVGIKLIGGFLIVALLIVAVGLVSFFNAQKLNDNVENLYYHQLQPVEYVSNIYKNLYQMRGDIYKYVLLTSERAKIKKDIDKSIVQINLLISDYEALEPEGEAAVILARLKETWKTYRKEADVTLALVDEGKQAEAIETMGVGANFEAQQAVDTSTFQLLKHIQDTASGQRDHSHEVFNATTATLAAASLVSVLLAISMGLVLTGSITIPLSRAVKMLQEIGKGHLNERLHYQRKDEIGILAETMDTFADDLQTQVIGSMQKISEGKLDLDIQPKDGADEITPALQKTAQALKALQMETRILSEAAANGEIMVRGDEAKFLGGYQEILHGFNNTLDLFLQPMKVLMDAAANINTASAEILAATTQQAAGASEQSAAISQTTTTVEEVKAISEQSLARTTEVASAAQRTVEVARTGRKAVQDTIASMNMIKERVERISENLLALSEQTQQIGEIISTVSEIAAQSNMLALNASVEAARAGEQGKGFAVVAAEVRSLAEQSRMATSQVKSIILEIQKATNTTIMATEEGTKGVDVGIQTVAQVNESIELLAETINEAAQVAIQVSAGGQQQQSGVEQIATAMQNINQATIQGLASTRQAERSAQNLNELAQWMAEAAQKFKVTA